MKATEAAAILKSKSPQEREYELIIETLMNSATKGYDYINFRILWQENKDRLEKDGYIVTSSQNTGHARRGHKITIPTNLD